MTREEAFKKLYKLACDAEEDGWLDNPMCVAENFLAFVEKELKMKPPCVSRDKCQKLMHKYIDPDFNMWDEDYDKLMENK